MPASQLSQLRDLPHRAVTYQPLLVVASASCLGVLLDAQAMICWPVWATSFCLAIVFWFLSLRLGRLRSAAIFVLAAACALAGGWHHFWYNWYGSNELGLLATRTAQPICIEGILLSQPTWVASPADSGFDVIPRGDGTRISIAATALVSADRRQRISDCTFES